ncbi:hypothetical protein Leryth_021292 [Lithospermum erythrorhizon]|nr:hypothetical protein Leryth_021292 [Lithospermum erythrorhizon]
MFYASKTFYDHHNHRRILWGWTGETDSEGDDLLKGWASLQTIPRTVVFDNKIGNNVLQWPVKEIESLRFGSTEFNDVKLQPGSVVPLKPDSSGQFDIVASFKVDKAALKIMMETNNVEYDCSNNGGAAARGFLGPFGLIVAADEKLTELTPIYFYIAKDSNGKTEVHFCADQLRSSQAFEAQKVVYGSSVPVLEDEDFTMRLLVDHSIVESFAQEGRMVITSRIYPTRAINGFAQIFVFNNATGISVSASIKIWDMESANIHNFPSL